MCLFYYKEEKWGYFSMHKKNIVNVIVKKSEYNNWETVFCNPMPINVETLNTGRINSKISGILNLNSSNAEQLHDGIANIPVLANLIRHEKNGSYLVDTGFDSSFTNKIGGNFKGIFKSFFFKNRYIQEDVSLGIENQLKERNIKLNGVFLTHIHEHASGTPSLPNDIFYAMGNGEREENFFPLVYSDFFKGKINIQKMDLSAGQCMPILGKCIDIFGDGSFWAFPTSGHTKGHTSYIVNGRDAQVMITGDVCVSKKGFDLNVETGKFSQNLEEGRKSFSKIKEFSGKYPHVKMIFGHETDEFKINYI